uniref:Wsv021-like protein n=1 Tax=Metapenaeus ensis majanivirus TaxID=2984279 RepID=A0A9C7BQI3_9VIRU|nr:MAG: wsv021-like protein [Metapenaeus ensis majanivirus]
MLILPILEVVIFLLLVLSLLTSVLIRYYVRYNKNKSNNNNNNNNNDNLYPIALLERQENDDNGSTIIKEYFANTKEFLLFTQLFRTIREFKPLTCKDDLAWYHYVYYISGCVFWDILYSSSSSKNNNHDDGDNNDSTTRIILNALASVEKNQLYVDYVFNLKKNEFDINNSLVRGDEKWMIKNVDDLIDDIHISKMVKPLISKEI